jgi:NAD(P)H-flavin reductase
LAKVEPYNHNTKVYHFSFDDDKVSGGQVASCLLVRTPEGEGQVLDDKGKPVIRPYTPISSPDVRGEVQLMIKEYKVSPLSIELIQNGALTPYISNLQIGQELLFKGPNPKYKYAPGNFDRGLCVAGGSGITPMYQLISHALTIPNDATKWTLVFSNVTEQDICES